MSNFSPIPSANGNVPATAGNNGAERTLTFDDATLANTLFGPQNEHLRLIADRFGVAMGSRGLSLTISGRNEAALLAENLVTQIYALLKAGHVLRPRDINDAAGIYLRSMPAYPERVLEAINAK